MINTFFAPVLYFEFLALKSYRIIKEILVTYEPLHKKHWHWQNFIKQIEFVYNFRIFIWKYIFRSLCRLHISKMILVNKCYKTNLIQNIFSLNFYSQRFKSKVLCTLNLDRIRIRQLCWYLSELFRNMNPRMNGSLCIGKQSRIRIRTFPKIWHGYGSDKNTPIQPDPDPLYTNGFSSCIK